jgi:hypothetical protein
MKNSAELKKTWGQEAKKALVGRKIVAVRYMTEEELTDHGWERSPLVMFLDDGTAIYPSSDDEGNGAGALFTTSKQFEIAPVI